MTTELTELRRKNFEEFIDTIPPDVKQLTELVFSYFKVHPAPYNFVFSEGTVYVYFNDEDFQTTGSIVAYLQADFDTPPFKPYRNKEEDALLGEFDIYLKLNQEILDASGYFADEPEEGAAELEAPVENATGEAVEVDDATPSPAEQTTKMAPLRPGDYEKTEEISHADVERVVNVGGDSDEGFDDFPSDEAVDAAPSAPSIIQVADEAEVPYAAAAADDDAYLAALKLIAHDVEQDALEVMRRTHAATGVIVPMTFVRLGRKLMIRTNQDQPSFDEHYEAIRDAAAEVFEFATEVSATKNNVQVVF